MSNKIFLMLIDDNLGCSFMILSSFFSYNSFGLSFSEYNIDKKYDAKLNKIAEKIYLKSKNKADIIKNVTLYVVNNLEYDYDDTYISLSMAELILKYKMGVCAHYAYLESQILNKLGIFSLDIGGYTGLKIIIRNCFFTSIIHY